MIPQDGAVHVIGAGGRSGSALVRALLAAGVAVQPVVRDAARWQQAAPPPHPLLAPPRMADLRDAAALGDALRDATRIVSTAHARTTPLLLAAAPAAARLVLLGSTRRFSRWPDAHGEGVREGEAALLASGRSGVMLHPTMIYGATGENNVQRLAALLRRLPVVPLPGGGRALVQPIHQDDVTRAIVAALGIDWAAPPRAGDRRARGAGLRRFRACRRPRRRADAAAHPRRAGRASDGAGAADRPAALPAARHRRRNPPASGGQGIRHRADVCHIGGPAGAACETGLARTFAS